MQERQLHRSLLAAVRAVLWTLLVVTFWIPARVLAQFPDGTWTFLPNSPDAGEGQRHSDIFFVTDQTGWIVNGQGKIYKTSDRGESWVLQLDTEDLDFQAVAFADENVGWAGSNTASQLLFETKDGGVSWDDITSHIDGDIPNGISAFWIVTGETIYATGSSSDGPWFLSTDTGGRSWSSRKIDSEGQTALDMYFADADRGLLVGGTREEMLGDAIVLKTGDGGKTWLDIIPTFKKTGVDGEWGAQLSFPSEFTGYLSIEYLNNRKTRFSKIMKTENLGTDWSEIEVFDNIVPFGLTGIGFITDDIGWTSGSGISSVTINGGANWESLIPYDVETPSGEMDGMVSRIFPVNSQLAYAAGRYVYRYDESLQTSIADTRNDVPKVMTLLENYPNPFSVGTLLRYTLESTSEVQLSVFDLLGSHVSTLVDQIEGPGTHSVYWDAKSRSGRNLPSGVYLFSLVTNGFQTTRKGLFLNE